MAAGLDSGARAVFTRQAREGAFYQGLFAAVALVLAGAVRLLNGPSWVAWILLVVGVYFLIGCGMDLLKYAYNKRPAPAGAASAADKEEETDDVVERLGLENGQVLSFRYARSLLTTHRDCIEQLRARIAGQDFPSQFADFRMDQARKYPKYAAQIADLQIDSVTVYRTRGKNCEGSVRFAGDLDEVWSARYTDGAFSDLIWD